MSSKTTVKKIKNKKKNRHIKKTKPSEFFFFFLEASYQFEKLKYRSRKLKQQNLILELKQKVVLLF